MSLSDGVLYTGPPHKEDNLMSVAISDLALSSMSLYAAWFLYSPEFVSAHPIGVSTWACGMHGSVGLFFIGFAAFFGVMRFAGITAVTPIHEFLSKLATCVGIPLIALAFACLSNPITWPKGGFAQAVGVLTIAFLMIHFMFPSFAEGYGVLLAAVSMVYILYRGYVTTNPFAMAAAIIFFIAAGIMDAENKFNGRLLGIRRVDIFHYFLTLASYCFLVALVR